MKPLLLPLLLATAVLGAGCGGDDHQAVNNAMTSAPTVAPGDTSASAGGGTDAASTGAGTGDMAPGTPAGGSPGSGAPSGPAKVDPKDYKTTPTGLKYSVLKPGAGAVAREGQTVAVHYTGWLKSNGTKFDSSHDGNEPISFPLGAGRVIPGWDEGVKGMKVGEKRQLLIPSKLGYGESGTPGGPIPPNAELVFDVELVKVQ